MLRTLQLARLSGGLHAYLRERSSVEAAVEQIEQRLALREHRFLETARGLIYGNPGSPYLRLLRHAGCAYADLEASVRSRGIESTLEGLRDEGVRLSLEEFRGRGPITRGGMTVHTGTSDFENPLVRRVPISGRSSGTRSPSARVKYNWQGLAEEAALELLVHQSNGDAGAPIGFWYPSPPASAGLRNLLIHLRIGRPPVRWFSQTAVPTLRRAPTAALGLAHLARRAARLGLDVPRPAPLGADGARTVARWMADILAREGQAVLMTFVSSAVRMAAEARAEGCDLNGGLVYAGGEPLTDERRRFLEASGLRVRARYIATETGPIGGQCGEMSGDRMHLFPDRLAVVTSTGTTHEPTVGRRPLLFTALSPHCARVLLNTEIGDAGELTTGTCGCVLGRLGMHAQVSSVRAHEKCTIEGMTVDASRLAAIVAEVLAPLGASPDAFQLHETFTADGRGRLVITLDPSVQQLDDADLVGAVLTALTRRAPDGALTAEVWRQADAVTVVRAPPQLTPGGKLRRFQTGQG